jgi:hypothetical protein
MSWLFDVFKVNKPAIGMIHLLPLPGAPQHDSTGGMSKILDAARRDLDALQEGGIGNHVLQQARPPVHLTADRAVTACALSSAHCAIPSGFLWSRRFMGSLRCARRRPRDGGQFVRGSLRRLLER